jgi:hypothetical protein
MEKIQRLWRAKRVFTNNQSGWKISNSKITTQVVTFRADVDFNAITPKGFSEIIGFKATSKTAKLRWTQGSGWIGNREGVTKMTLKKGQHTIILSSSSIDILGPGNYEPALLACVKSGFVSKSVLNAKPTYKNINGIFYVNKPFLLDDLATELRHIPTSMREKITPYASEFGIPAVVLKLKNPKWTYQFFQNGTVLFSGIKDPSELDEPRKLFKQFFTEYNITPFLVMNMRKSSAIGKPVSNSGSKKTSLANRNPLAGNWSSLKNPPYGFYIRPGTNGKPRFYMWKKMEQNKTTREWKNMGPMNLTAVAPKVVKAFKNAGKNIPQSTINSFQTAGYPLSLNVNKNTGPSENRRAPSWNATKPGFYVRPGPGQQPYWFKVPSGLASGRKTVISTYTKAGRNIPAAVRAIFGIGENVKTNTGGTAHKIEMGLNGMIRINGRQASRLTKPQLIAIARNMNIAQANTTMNPSQIIKLIQNKSGVKGGGNRSYNLKLNEVYYRFLNNGRVEKTQANKKGFAQRTSRNWSTIPVADQNKLAKAFLPASYHNEYKNKKYSVILKYKNSLKPNTPSEPNSNSDSNSNLGNLANFAAEVEHALKNEQHKNTLRSLVGNYYRNENANKLLVRLSKLPVTAKKINTNRAIKTFAKEAIIKARRNLIEANYKSKVVVPNWLPNNIKNSYRTALMGAALQVNNKGKYPSHKAVKNAMQVWINIHVPKVGKPAYTKENVITGQVIHVPEWNPPKNPRANVPKRLSPPRPAPKKKSAAPKKKKSAPNTKKYRLNENSNNANNMGSALIGAGLNTKGSYSWNNLVRFGVNKKYKNVWARQLSA